MASPPYKQSIRPGDIKFFKIKGSKDLSGSIAEFYYYESILANYYESILANTVTATVAFMDTGFEKEGNTRLNTSGIIDDLELVGGEEIEFEVIDNNDVTSESEGTLTSAVCDSVIRM
jgi:hypothetical protein